MSDRTSRAELLSAIHKLTTQLGWAPLATDMRDHGPFQLHQYYEMFGNWDAALESAGVNKEAALIRDIQLVDQHVKDTPTTTDMREIGHYSSGVHTLHFGSWDEALEQAGLERNNTEEPEFVDSTTESQDSEPADMSPTREDYLEEITRLQETTETVVRAHQMDADGSYSASEIISTFESWNDALEAAGIDKSAILQKELQRVAIKLGRPPTQPEMNELGRCSPTMYVDVFGSWSEAKDTCLDAATEITADNRRSMLRELTRVNESVEGILTAREIRIQGEYGVHEISEEFGTLDNALETAGIDREAQILGELRRVAEEVDRRPTLSLMSKYGKTSSATVMKYFDSFEDAVQRALDGSSSESHSPEQPDDLSQEDPEVDAADYQTISDLDSEGRVDLPLTVKINAIDHDPGDRVDVEIQVEDLNGDSIDLKIWKTHSIDINWMKDHWYVLEDARVKVWEPFSDEFLKQLSSTGDLRVRHLGTSHPTEAQLAQSESSTTETPQADEPTLAKSSGSSSTDPVGAEAGSGTDEESELDRIFDDFGMRRE